MKCSDYTDDQILAALQECNGDKAAAARRLGLPRSTLRYRLNRISRRPTDNLGVSGGIVERATEIVQESMRPGGLPGWRDCLAGFQKAKEFREDFSISYRHVKCRIKTDSPIALSAITDVHLGSPHTDYEAFEADISQIIDDPRFFVLKGGDWIDKFMPQFRDKSAPMGQLQPAQIQLVTVDQIMLALMGRIVAAVGGNHDPMDERQTGISSEYWIHRGKPFPYMSTGGLVELTVGDQPYRILWTHQYGVGHSRLNPHNVFRWLRDQLDATCDIYILEHHHDPSILTREIADFQKRTVVEIRTGSYKIDDRYSQQFFKDGRRGPQTVVLWPDRHKITPMHGADAIEDARIYLNGLKGTP